VSNLSLPKKRLIKPVVAAVIVALLISGIVIFVLPQYIYISPFSSFYASGLVDHKSVGYSTNSNGDQITSYTVSITLLNDDPLNHVSEGQTLAYVVSKADWDMVAPMDTVKIKLFPNAQAEIVDLLYPAVGHLPLGLPLNISLTPSKPAYTAGETANFTVRLTNDPQLSDGIPTNVTLALFKNCIFYVFGNGKLIASNENLLNNMEVESVNMQPWQEMDFSFNWDLAGVQSGIYWVRAYIGYFPALQSPSVTLTETIMINVVE
jgi:hypothetical protein